MRAVIGGRRCRDANVQSIMIQLQDERDLAKRCYTVPELRGGGGCVGKCSYSDAIAPLKRVHPEAERSDLLDNYRAFPESTKSSYRKGI